ncbi:MAG: pyridinium-3,5-bisthiocarboxylic acid mononucleotide nickel chelatase [Desulfonauticus sp.]|nr:pyridinium-3,5-bisthiocarboxylic acid mononucleotide nickel chelatase [Desulfonauticus sp.]
MACKRVLFLDLSWGISGDMLVSALADMQVDFSDLVSSLEQKLKVKIEFKNFSREGVLGKKLEIRLAKTHKNRKLRDLLDLLSSLELSPELFTTVKEALFKLARIEAKIHSQKPEEVHFHELGGEDILVDLVLALGGIEKLGVDKVMASPLPWLQGEVEIGHGKVPLPAPATLALLQGKPFSGRFLEFEAITPTGALLLDWVVDGFSKAPQGTLLSQGVGFGTWDKGFNGLRCFLLEEEMALEEEEVYLLESNVDHLSGEELGEVFNTFLQAGALDVLFLPGLMKKNRPGGLLQVLCPPDKLAPIQSLFFKTTFTLGVRIRLERRVVVKRWIEKVSTSYGEVRLKCFQLPDKKQWRIEAEDIKAVARQEGCSFLEAKKLLEEEVGLYFFQQKMGS